MLVLDIQISVFVAIVEIALYAVYVLLDGPRINSNNIFCLPSHCKHEPIISLYVSCLNKNIFTNGTTSTCEVVSLLSNPTGQFLYILTQRGSFWDLESSDVCSQTVRGETICGDTVCGETFSQQNGQR